MGGEVLLQLGWRVFGEGFRASQRAHPVLSVLALILAGVLLGVLTNLLVPNRLFPFQGIRGASLVLSPLVTGALMHWYGKWCDRRGRERSNFATFWGGAVFALSMTFVRFYFVGART